MKNIFKFLFLLLFIAACTKSTARLKIKKLSLDKELSQFSDSTYFSDVRSINYNANKYYLSDYKRNQIIELDDNLKLISAYGSVGDGPGEFRGVTKLLVQKDTVYAMNDYKRTIEVYDKGKYIKTIVPPKAINLSTDKDFVKFGENFYLSNVNKKGSICKFNVKNNNVTSMGALIPFSSSIQLNIRNSRYILEFNSKIITISDNLPLIELLDGDGNNIVLYNYEKLDFVKDREVFIENKKLSRNSYLKLVSDVSIVANKLYLLILTYNKKLKKVQSNKILVVDINKDNTFKPDKIIDLGNDCWIDSFCVNENSILVFDAVNSRLIKYTI